MELERKLFVGGLDVKTTEETLKDYFTQWGELVDIVLMLHPNTNKSRGFAFITFEDIESARNTLLKKDHMIDAKAVEVKKAKPKELIENKIFIRGLATTTTTEDVRNCFAEFCEENGGGEIRDVLLLKEKHCARIRPYGFITVDSVETAGKICRKGEFVIKTKSVRVEPARTRYEMLKKQGEYLYCI
jgi:RNA-binding protein Musashi